MKKTALLGLGLALVAGSASASNTGFKLNYSLEFGSTGQSNNNWLSVPYFYFPNGNVGQTPQNSIDLCRDLNGGAGTGKVSSVIKYLSDTDTAKTQPCSSGIKAFDLKSGEGYSVKPSAAGITIDIVGSHDDTYAPNKTTPPTLYGPLFFGAAGSGRSNNNWFSVPYHTKADNSLGVCAELRALTGNKIGSFIQYLSKTDTAKTQPCSSGIKAFDLKPGEGYSVKPTEAGVSIGLEVY